MSIKRAVRTARNRSTRSERTAPTGTDLFSKAGDARVERVAAGRSASWVTTLRFICLPVLRLNGGSARFGQDFEPAP